MSSMLPKEVDRLVISVMGAALMAAIILTVIGIFSTGTTRFVVLLFGLLLAWAACICGLTMVANRWLRR